MLPSLVLLLLLSWIYLTFGDVSMVAGVLYGIKPAVVAIVAFAGFRIGSRVLKNWAVRALAILAFTAIWIGGVPFPAIVIGAALLGAIGAWLRMPQFAPDSASHLRRSETAGRALIDDDTPVPAHARFSVLRLSIIVGTGVLLWCGAMAALVESYGIDSPLPQIGWFFTKAALLTFGGAYAVLPYVYQGAVVEHGWLTALQMIDGLALGETTPGPLIMVVTYVGFVAGWSREVLGGDSPALGGVLAACVATFFTFLPSFLFILAGGPAVEASRNDLRVTGPLLAITAAVVGVIVNLALFFSYHVLWPAGFDGAFEWAALVIGLAGAMALWRSVGVIAVIVGAAVLGALWHSVAAL